MKLVSLNIEKNKHYDVVFDFFKKENPDVICLQELLENDFSHFKKKFNMEGVFKVTTYIENQPHYRDVEGEKQGNAIFSNNIINSGATFYEGREENLCNTYEEFLSDEETVKNRALLWADIKDEEGVIHKFVTTHLPVTKEGESSPYQLKVVDLFLAKLDLLGEFVLCGDMNAPRGNETFTRLAKKYKDNIPLEYKTSIDQNLHRVKGIQLMVDGLFTTTNYKASNVKLIDGISDHMAIVAEITKD